MLRTTGKVLGALAACAIVAVCAVQVTKSTAQSVNKEGPETDRNASPIYGITIPAGYRDWRFPVVYSGGYAPGCVYEYKWRTIYVPGFGLERAIVKVCEAI